MGFCAACPLQAMLRSADQTIMYRQGSELNVHSLKVAGPPPDCVLKTLDLGESQMGINVEMLFPDTLALLGDSHALISLIVKEPKEALTWKIM